MWWAIYTQTGTCKLYQYNSLVANSLLVYDKNCIFKEQVPLVWSKFTVFLDFLSFV